MKASDIRRYKKMERRELLSLPDSVKGQGESWKKLILDEYPAMGEWLEERGAHILESASILSGLLPQAPDLFDLNVGTTYTYHSLYVEMRRIGETEELTELFGTLFDKVWDKMHFSSWQRFIDMLDAIPYTRALLLLDEDGATQMFLLMSESAETVSDVESIVGAKRSFWEFFKEFRDQIASTITVYNSEGLTSKLGDPELPKSQQVFLLDRKNVASRMEDEFLNAKTAEDVKTIIESYRDRWVAVPVNLFLRALDRISADGQTKLGLLSLYLRSIFTSRDNAKYIPDGKANYYIQDDFLSPDSDWDAESDA